MDQDLPNSGSSVTEPFRLSSVLGESSSSAVEPFSDEQLSHDLALFLSNPSLKTALADGSLDLESYSSTVEGELFELEKKCIENYREKTTEIAVLCMELENCDGILLGLQEMLLGFQADLGGLSGDIRKLQETSKRLGVQLHNRKNAALGLRDFLGRIILSPQLVNTIVKGPVNDEFQQSIVQLSQLYRDTHEEEQKDWSCGEAPTNTVAGKEMQAHIQQLRLVAVSRIRDFFYKQMSLLRIPQTNIRILQSHGLLHYADLYDFLMDSSPNISQELFKVYCGSMSKTMYVQNLTKDVFFPFVFEFSLFDRMYDGLILRIAFMFFAHVISLFNLD